MDDIFQWTMLVAHWQKSLSTLSYALLAQEQHHNSFVPHKFILQGKFTGLFIQCGWYGFFCIKFRGMFNATSAEEHQSKNFNLMDSRDEPCSSPIEASPDISELEERHIQSLLHLPSSERRNQRSQEKLIKVQRNYDIRLLGGEQHDMWTNTKHSRG